MRGRCRKGQRGGRKVGCKGRVLPRGSCSREKDTQACPIAVLKGQLGGKVNDTEKWGELEELRWRCGQACRAFPELDEGSERVWRIPT